jgi:hypothetical protein
MQAAETRYSELAALHESELLPHWAQGAAATVAPIVASGLAGGKQFAAKCADKAGDFWAAQGAPALDAALSKAADAKSHFVALAGEKLPVLRDHVGRAVAAGRTAAKTTMTTAKAVWNSPALARVVPAMRSVGATVSTQGAVVVTELRGLVVSLSQRHPTLSFLGAEPVSSSLVFVVLALPFVALGLPLLGRRPAVVAAPTSSGTTRVGGGTSKGKKSAKKEPRERRISYGIDSVRFAE